MSDSPSAIRFRWTSPAEAWAGLPKNFRTAFLSAALIGTVTHLFAFTNLLVNHDSVSAFLSQSDYLYLGRWASKWFSMLSTNLVMPSVMVLLSVLYLSATAALTVYFLQISSSLNTIFISGFIAIFPAVASVLSYGMEYFLAALLLSAAGAVCIRNYRYGWIPGILLIATGLGVYQSFFAYAVGLLLFDCVLRLIAQEPVFQVVKRGAKYILALLASTVLYYVILQYFLNVRGIELSAYKGLNTMGFSNMKTYLAAIPVAYRDFLTFFLSTPYLSDTERYIQYALAVLSCISTVYLIYARKIYRNLTAFILLLTGIALIPLALSITSVISTERIYIINQYAYVLHFVFCLKLIEQSITEARSKGLPGIILAGG